MIRIKTRNDIEKLEKDRIFSIDYMEEIRTRLRDAYENLKEEGQTIDELNLEEQGEIIILQKDDDVRNLEEIGLDPDEGAMSSSYAVNILQTTFLIGRILMSSPFLFSCISPTRSYRDYIFH